LEGETLKYEELILQNQDIHFQPKLTIPSSAFGALRRELIDTLGIKRSKGFLLRYGWNCGVADFKPLVEMDWENPKDLILLGPKMHTDSGHVTVEPKICEVDFENGNLHFEGDWINSTEAIEHIKLFGYSDEPVCHSLVGYASGALSNIMGKQVIARETQCMAMGDDHCHWVCKTVEDWNGDLYVEQERQYYKADHISDELEETYEKLRLERDGLSKTYNIHLKLFKEVIYETGLQSLSQVLYETMTMPVIIESLHGEPRAFGGMSEQEATKYSDEWKEWLSLQQNKKGRKNEINQTVFIEISPEHKRLITPIYFRQKIHGYCSLLAEKDAITEADKMILGQAALACSLHFLNEKTRFNTEQRIRGSFLNDILNKTISMSEINLRAHYIDFELKPPYFMVTLQQSTTETSMKEKIEYTDQLMNDLFKYLETKQVKGIIGKKSDDVIILFSEPSLATSHSDKESFCKSLFDYCTKIYHPSIFNMGVSSSKSLIEDASKLYKESIASLKIAKGNQNLVFFDSLGIIGMLLQTKDLEAVKDFSYKILGNLIEEDRSKNMELIKTLYYYLENGSNAYKTARAMNFSINGLRYRLKRINEILELDINSAYNRHEIYLALQCLIVLKEL
jgi:PucR family transcriptional regulator, purine catabolism regulatory protein